MKIATTRFGTIDVKDDSIVQIKSGMLGFEHCTSYVLLEDRPDTVIKWMQAVEDPSVAFMVINPCDFFPDYSVELTDEQAETLELTDAADCVMFTTVSVSQDEGKVTTNLAGPIVMNVRTLCASQVVLQDDRYCTRHSIGERAKAQTPPELAKAA